MTENDATADILCDPPVSTLQAGHNIYRGVEHTRACESPVICLHQLIRKKHVRPYLDGLRASMPREMDRVFCNKLWEQLGTFGTNLSETGPGSLEPSVGNFNGEPAAVLGQYLAEQVVRVANRVTFGRGPDD